MDYEASVYRCNSTDSLRRVCRGSLADGGTMSEAVILSIISLAGTIVIGAFTFVVNLYRIKANTELQTLKQTVCDQQGEINDLKTTNEKLEKNNRALWQWTLALLEYMKKKNVKPLPPPTELQSDPELARLVVFEPRKQQRPKKKASK